MSKVHEKFTLKHEIAWIWSRMHAWLAALDPAQRNWLVQLQTSHVTPPRKYSNAHRKSLMSLVLKKHRLKARNHMNAESCGCMVDCNGSGTMQLTSAASIATYFSAKNGQLCCSWKRARVRKEICTALVALDLVGVCRMQAYANKRHENIWTCVRA